MRTHVHEEAFHTTPERLFRLIHTPSDIRKWWGVSHAIVIPEPGGLWSAIWGDEDDPDYVTTATMKVFDPPRRIVFGDYRYKAKSGPMPFQADFETEFFVTPIAEGATLRVTQAGFPSEAIADDFYAACQTGWKNTFAGIRKLVEA
jgi:uncharacterized protein YndB with AHSA1/START domain